jgi:hypothetical protein
MSLSELQEFDSELMFTDFGASVTYEGESITAVVEYGDNRAAGNTVSSDGQAARATLWIKASDVSEPVPLDKVVVDGETWWVVRISERHSGVFCLEATGNEAAL